MARAHEWDSNEAREAGRKSGLARATDDLEYNGECMSVPAWAAKLGINLITLRGRLHRGWSAEQALGTPVRPVTPPNRPRRKPNYG